MQDLLGKPRIPSGPLFVFDTQPLAKPPARMLLHGSVGFTDRTQAEVVRPTIDLPVERCYQRCRILLGLTPSGHLADRLTDDVALVSWTEWCPNRPAPSSASSIDQTCTRENRTSLPAARQTRVLLSFTVNFSFDIMFRIRTSASSALATTADHEIIGIINDVRFQTLLVPQFLPPEHEPTHV